MLGPVLNLQQTAQDATGTSFSWDAVALADAYAVSLDGSLLTTVTTTAVKVPAAAAGTGAHTIGVAPVANPTAATTLPFSVSSTPPPVPTGLTVSLEPETQPVGVILAWNPSTGAVKYQILQNGTALGAEPAVTSGVVVQGQSLGQTYAYQVAAIDASGNTSAPCAAVSVTIPPTWGTTAPPPAPTGLTASATATEVDLACDPTPTATSYNWYKGSALYQTTTLPALVDTAVLPNTTYHYNVQAVNAAGPGPRGVAIDVTTPKSGGTPPPVPTGLAASGTSATGTVLKWNASTGAVSYTVFEGGTALTPSPTTTTLTVAGLSPATAYKFTVRANGPGGSSAQSAAITVTTSGSGTAPPVPTGLAASGTTATGTTLKWNASAGATSYTVFEGGTALTPDVTGTSLSVTGLQAATAYQFTVRANNQFGDSAQSAAITVTTSAAGSPPPVPTGLAASGTTASATSLKWNASAGASSYVVQEQGGANLPAPGTTLNVTGLAASTMYQFAVAAVGPGGQSAFSAPISVTTQASGGVNDCFVFVIYENSGVDTVTPAACPNIWKLINGGAYAKNYAATDHPSAPNYLALTCGRDLQSGSDAWNAYPYQNIIDLLEAAGISWGVYCENLPSNWTAHPNVGLYAQRHNPFGYYTDVYTNAARAAHVKDFTAFVPGAEQWQWITPNLTDDGHTPGGAAGAKNADAFTAKSILPILSTPPFAAGKKSVLGATWDECDGTGCAAVPNGKGGLVIATLAGPGAAKPGTVSTVAYNHYSMLKTWEAFFGLGSLGQGDATAAVMSDLLA